MFDWSLVGQYSQFIFVTTVRRRVDAPRVCTHKDLRRRFGITLAGISVLSILYRVQVLAWSLVGQYLPLTFPAATVKCHVAVPRVYSQRPPHERAGITLVGI